MLESSVLHQGDSGVELRFAITDANGVVDISEATSLAVTLRRPNGTALYMNAIFDTDGTDGVLKVTTDSTTLDAVGAWLAQAVIVINGSTKHGVAQPFRVYPSIG